ncbi:MAG: transposase [Fluviicola sp.]|nr:transposase [Fluviicola sp.]
MIKHVDSTFADSICDLRTRKIKQTFFEQINRLLDWDSITKLIEVEYRVNDSISFSYFCGMSIEEIAPDHNTISRFRTALTKTKTYDKLFKLINSQLEAHQIIVKTEAIVDASVIDTPLRPKGKTNHKVT